MTDIPRGDRQPQAAAPALSDVVRSLPVAVAVLDADGSIIEANPALIELLGMDMAAAHGKPLDVLSDDGATNLSALARTACDSGSIRETSFRARDRSGRTFAVSLHLSGIKGTGSVAVLSPVQSDDASEQHFARAFEAEREIVEQLRALDDMKNSFLSALSHELRTPVTAILGMARTVERELERLDPSDVKELTRRISGKAAKLDRLLNDLLDLDRLRLGMIEPVRRTGNIADLVRAVVDDLELPQRARIELDLEDVLASVDHPQAERIVENLVMNALTHTPPGTPIWIKTSARDRGVLLTVEDAGLGISPHLRESIFEPFHQADTAPHAPGVGIGLSLVARFAEIHGGRAWVEEREGGGASFRVYLPSGPAAR